MIGNNKLQLNQAEMNKAVEYYLNNVVFKIPCCVTNIEYTTNNGYIFIVSITPVKEETTVSSALLSRAIELEKQ